MDDSPSYFEGIRELLCCDISARFFNGFASVMEAFNRLERTHREKPGLVLSETQLADGKFMDYFKKAHFGLPPICIVSLCRNPELIDQALDFGVWDYFTKPVDPVLLATKLNRLIKEHRESDPVKRFLRLEATSFSVLSPSGLAAQLTQKQFQILTILYDAYPKPVSRAEIRQTVWGSVKVVPKTLDVHLFSLRRKLEPFRIEIRSLPNALYVLRSSNI